MSSIQDLLITEIVNAGEEDESEVVSGFKSIEDIIADLAHSKIVMYLSYTGGLRLTLAISKYNEAKALQQEREDDPMPDEPEVEPLDPEEALTDSEKALIYAAYLLS